MRTCVDRHGDPGARPLSTFEIVQSLLARIAAQDAEGVSRLFAARVEWRANDLTGVWREAGVRSRREVESFFLAMFSSLELEEFTVRRLLVDSEDAVVLGQARWSEVGTEAVHDIDFVLNVSVHKGKVTECWLMQDLGTESFDAGISSDEPDE